GSSQEMEGVEAKRSVEQQARLRRLWAARVARRKIELALCLFHEAATNRQLWVEEIADKITDIRPPAHGHP
ncbi:hypothetical protein, partial [Limimaricola variabilis]|uniref:hypothetical protein n=1 Tax=Limimaricola variabilis TaxID=1492771 RepID=UPI001C85F6C2